MREPCQLVVRSVCGGEKARVFVQSVVCFRTKMKSAALFLLFLAFISIDRSFVEADTPANCTFEDIRGHWIFSETERSGNRSIGCETMGPVVHQFEVWLDFPNVASDASGNLGHWTMIYNQGFEVTIMHRKFFAFSYYVQDGQRVTSYCDRTYPGWSHDVLTNNWACYTAKKVKRTKAKGQQKTFKHLQGAFLNNEEFVNEINSVQTSWKAKVYPEYEGRPLAEMHAMRGGVRSRKSRRQPLATVTPEVARKARALPKRFDWRNVEGQNFVSPVRNQGGCGSCYAFASMAMLEARLRVATNNSVQLVFSPQDIVSCSQYSQGCSGGFSYLIAGKYAQDFGVVEENCNPYLGADGECRTKGSCIRHYVHHYGYVGGYDGGSNEELMKIALVEHGPMAVAIEVYSDFQSYASGIYHHTGLTDKWNPFEETNHAVLLVGYGVDETSAEKYWIGKNSWGEMWGERGFFRIRRGTDECAFESLALESFVIP